MIRAVAIAPLALLALAASGPTPKVGPVAVGAPVVGQRLTAEHGTWSGSGTTAYRYQWYRCDAAAAHCKSIHGATAPSYRIVAADVSHTVALTVTASDSSGSAPAYASVVGPVVAASSPVVSTVQPAASGDVRQGLTVTVDTGAWSRKPASVAYAWLRCNANGRACSEIGGATASTYIVTAGDAGHALVARVTATSGSASAAALSSAVLPESSSAGTTTTTPSTGPGPKSTAAPIVTGTAAQNGKLSATSGSWVGSGTLTYHFQWYRCDTSGAHCSSIHGATAPTYTVVAQDVAHTIGLTVSATDSTGTASAYGHLLGPIAKAGTALVSSAQPTVSGTPREGQTLTVSQGGWTTPPASYDYAWQRCNANGRLCAPIAGATSQTYKVAAADQGHQLLALVHAVAGNDTGEALSTAVLVG